MALPRFGDVSFQNEVPLSQMMEMVANKRAREVELQNAQIAQRQSQMNTFRQTVADTSQLVESMVKKSTERQQANARNVLASIFLEPKKDDVVSRRKIGVRGGTETMGVPTPKGFSGVNPATGYTYGMPDTMKVANVPEGGEFQPGEDVFMETKYGETPRGKTQDARKLAALLQGFPEQAGKQLAEQAFPELKGAGAKDQNYLKNIFAVGEKVYGIPGRLDENGKPLAAVEIPVPGGERDPLTKPTLPNEAVKEIAGNLSAMRQLNTLRETFNADFTGPIEGRLREFERTVGIDLGQLKNADQQKFQTTMFNAVNQYIKATTGAQMSEPEAKRIQRALPSVYRADEAFIPQLDAAIREVEGVLRDRVEAYKAAGYRGADTVTAVIDERAPKKKPTTANPKDPLGLFP